MHTLSRALLVAALTILAAWAPAPPVAGGPNLGTVAPPLYVEVTGSVGLGGFLHGGHTGADREPPYFLEITGPGACWLDVDNDDDIDLYLVSGKHLTHEENNTLFDPHSRLYRNDGGTFVEDGGRLFGWYQGCSAADYDNDGWTDLYVTGWAGSVLLRNNGVGGFTNVTTALGVADEQCGSWACWGSSASWFDADRDGCLDLFVNHFGNYSTSAPGGNGPEGAPGQENRFFRGSCGGPFVDVTAASGLGGVFSNSWSSMSVDMNGDSWPDLYVSNDGDENDVYINDGDGTFTRIVNEASDLRNGMGTAVGDLNGDGRADIITTNFIQQTNGIFLAQPAGGYVDIGVNAPFDDAIPYSGWATTIFDADQDGRSDVMVVNGITEYIPLVSYWEPLLLYLNRGGDTFEQARTFTGPAMLSELIARGAAWGDYDNDGDLDVLVAEAGASPTHLYEATRSSGNFLIVDLVGGAGVNRDAIGARVTVGAQMRERTAGDGYLSSSDPRLHFGLGHAQTTNVHVRWPDGTSQTFADVRANSAVRITQGSADAQTLWTQPIVRIDAPSDARRLAPTLLSASAIDADAPIVSWTWTFPDGSTASGPSVTHAFTALGPRHVLVTAVDSLGREKTQSVSVRVYDEITIEFAPDAELFLPGQNVTATVRAFHSDGSPVPEASISVAVGYTNGEDLDALAGRLPRAARIALGYVDAWANGTTDASGTFRFSVPPNLRAPGTLLTVGTHAPGEYPMIARGHVYGYALPEASATARVGVQ